MPKRKISKSGAGGGSDGTSLLPVVPLDQLNAFTQRPMQLSIESSKEIEIMPAGHWYVLRFLPRRPGRRSNLGTEVRRSNFI